MLNDDIHADKCLVRKVFRIINRYYCAYKAGGFTNGLGSIQIDVVDAVAMEKNGGDNEVLIRINQAVSKPD